jgi:hypothetical protein
MEDNYKSPLKKLVTFFEMSRDQWKKKAVKAKIKNKLCQNRIKFLEMSKASLKTQNKELKNEKEKLLQELKMIKSKNDGEQDKKKL